MDKGVSAYEALMHVIQDLKHFDPVFEETYFKFINNLPADNHFKELCFIPFEE